MASLTQLTAASNEESLKSVEKKRVLNCSTRSTFLTKHDFSLSSSSGSQSTPSGKSHAGEVRRRTDRQTGPLPAPGLGQSGSGDSTNESSRKPRRRNPSKTGGYNSDSDSDDEPKRGKSHDGHDGFFAKLEAELATRPNWTPLHHIQNDETEPFDQSMQQALALVRKEMLHYASPFMQRQQMALLTYSMPPSTEASSIRSKTYDLMIEYLDTLETKVIRVLPIWWAGNQTKILDTYITSTVGNWPDWPDWLKEYCAHVSDVEPVPFVETQHGRVIFKYVQLDEKVPPYVMDLWRYRTSYRAYGTVVLRVMVKKDIPIYTKVVSKEELEYLGWWFCSDTRTWCRCHVEKNGPESVIYQMDIKGRITKLWEIADADKHPGFQSFLATRRALESERAEVRLLMNISV